MFSHNQNSSSRENNTWSPSLWDMYGNASQVLDGLKRKADIRVNFSSRELGSDAGRFVLDQYYAAKGETDKSTVIKAFFSINNLTYFLAMIMPLIGIIAAIGVDYAIYGEAAKGMDTSKMLFNLNAFGIGSLIFAGALGLSEKFKNLSKTIVLYLVTFIATLGASFIVADDDKNELRERFTKSLRSAFPEGSDDEYAKVESLKSQIESLKTAIADINTRLKTGGNKGMNMKGDGTDGNDAEADDLIADRGEIEGQLSKYQKELDAAIPAFNLAKRKDPLALWGRLLAALYTAAWLFAAQLMVAEVIRTAFDNFKETRNKIVERNKQKKFFNDLENTDNDIREKAIQAAVNSTLSRFSEILSTSKPDSKNSQKHDNFAELFEEDSYNEMVKTATAIVSAGIIV
jgi:hypothetical protein